MLVIVSFYAFILVDGMLVVYLDTRTAFVRVWAPCRGQVLSRESASLRKGSRCFILLVCFSSSHVLPQLRTRTNMTLWEHQLGPYRVTVSCSAPCMY
ncbi:hypothetical protein V8C34DRAFT_287696 [Trichoderma compactum]